MNLDRARSLLARLSINMDATFIYALLDPDTGYCRYVGKAHDPFRRYLKHLSCAMRQSSRTYNTHTGRWIRLLSSQGKAPCLTIIEWAGRYEWQERERYWISFFLNQGCRLTNSSDGGLGGGARRGHKSSDETRAKISAARKGKTFGPRGPFSEKARAAISAGLKRAGVKPPPHAYEKALQVNRGRVAWNRGIPASPETRALLSKQRIGNKYTLGYKHTPESLELMSKAQRARRERERNESAKS